MKQIQKKKNANIMSSVDGNRLYSLNDSTKLSNRIHSSIIISNDLKILYVNKRFALLLEKDINEIISNDILSIFPASESKKIKQLHSLKENQLIEIQINLLTKRKNKIPIIIMFSKIIIGNEDNGYIATIKETLPFKKDKDTEPIVYEDKVHGAIVYNQRHECIGCNTAMESITGLEADSILGKNAFQVFPFLLKTGSDYFIKQSLKGKQVVAKDRVYSIPASKRYGFYEAYYSPLYNKNEKIIGCLAIVHDITQDKILELQQSRILREAIKEKEQNESHNHLEDIVENMNEAFISLDNNLCFTYLNKAAERILKSEKDELLSSEIRLISPELANLSLQALEKKNTYKEYYNEISDEWFLININPTIKGITIHFRSITDSKKNQEQVYRKIERQKYVASFGEMALLGTEITALMDEASRMIADTLNVEYTKILELKESKKALLIRSGVGWEKGIVGKVYIDLDQSQAGYTWQIKKPVLVKNFSYETRFKLSDLLSSHHVISGISVVVEEFGILTAHTTQERVFTLDDINFIQSIANILAMAIQRKRHEDVIKFNAYHDNLTLLPNRNALIEKLRVIIQKETQTNYKSAILYIDLDRFKNINDSLGHNVGDKFIKEVAKRISKAVKKSDIVARAGGDEFIVLLKNISTVEQSISTAKKILEVLSPIFMIDAYALHLNASIGISVYPLDGKTPTALIQNAGAALHKAKDMGINTFQLYNKQMHLATQEKLNLEADLRKGIDKNEFIIYYQPIINLRKKNIASIEALVRWNHPQLGLILPDTFIPLAEETGLIIPLGCIIFKNICQQMKLWKKQGILTTRVAFNLSLRQMSMANIFEKALKTIKANGLSCHDFEIEVTETTAMRSIKQDSTILRQLKQSGMTMSIDDFGIGQSSLTHLKSMPIDKLKIDKSFIKDCTRNKEDTEIIKTIVSLAHNLNLKVVAEGVETEDQMKFLDTIMCDEIQGYIISKPVPGKIIETDFLQADNWR